MEKHFRSQVEKELRTQAEKDIRTQVESNFRVQLEKDIRSQLEKEVRAQVEMDVRSQLEKETRSLLEKELSAGQARVQDLERQVRELEGIVRRRQQPNVLPCSDRERRLEDQLQEQLRERHAAVAKVQGQLHAVKVISFFAISSPQKYRSNGFFLRCAFAAKGKFEDLVASLQEQLDAARQEVLELKERVILLTSAAPSAAPSAGPSAAPSAATSSASSEAGDPPPDQDDEPRVAHGHGPGPRRRPRRSQSVGESAPGAGAGTVPEIQVMPHQQNRPTPPSKPDSHLLATIRGLQHELNTK